MKKWNLIIDVDNCTNCNMCTLASKDEHVGNAFPGYSAEMPKRGAEWKTTQIHWHAPQVVRLLVPTCADGLDLVFPFSLALQLSVVFTFVFSFAFCLAFLCFFQRALGRAVPCLVTLKALHIGKGIQLLLSLRGLLRFFIFIFNVGPFLWIVLKI